MIKKLKINPSKETPDTLKAKLCRKKFDLCNHFKEYRGLLTVLREFQRASGSNTLEIREKFEGHTGALDIVTGVLISLIVKPNGKKSYFLKLKNITSNEYLKVALLDAKNLKKAVEGAEILSKAFGSAMITIWDEGNGKTYYAVLSPAPRPLRTAKSFFSPKERVFEFLPSKDLPKKLLKAGFKEEALIVSANIGEVMKSERAVITPKVKQPKTGKNRRVKSVYDTPREL